MYSCSNYQFTKPHFDADPYMHIQTWCYKYSKWNSEGWRGMFEVTQLQQRWDKQSNCLSVLEQKWKDRLNTYRAFSFSSRDIPAIDTG